MRVSTRMGMSVQLLHMQIQLMNWGVLVTVAVTHVETVCDAHDGAKTVKSEQYNLAVALVRLRLECSKVCTSSQWWQVDQKPLDRVST